MQLAPQPIDIRLMPKEHDLPLGNFSVSLIHNENNDLLTYQDSIGILSLMLLFEFEFKI